MSTVLRDIEIDGWAHCVHPFCPGNEQQPVKARLVETGLTFAEQGGDLGGIDRSFVRVTIADEADAPCPHCSRVREVTDQVRRDYMPLSGHDPSGLLKFKYPEEFKANETDDQKKQRLREELAALEAA